MTPQLLCTFTGGALIASGVLATLGFAFHPHDATGADYGAWVLSHSVIFIGFLLGLLGTLGLYGAMASRLGYLGLAGTVIAITSVCLYLCKLYWSGFMFPLVAQAHPDFIVRWGLSPGMQPVDPAVRAIFYLGPWLFAIGYGLLGWQLARARCFPLWPLILVVVGALLVGVWPWLPGPLQHFSALVSLVFAVGMAWLGGLLWRQGYGKVV